MAFIPRSAPGLQNPLTDDIMCADKAVLDASQIESERLTLTGLELQTQTYVLGYNPLSGEVTYWNPPDGELVAIGAGHGIELTGPATTPQINLETLGMPTTAYWPSSIEVDEYGRVIDVETGTRPITSIQANTGELTASTTAGETTIGLASVGTANTYAYPQSLTTDTYGRVTSVTAGSAPTTYTGGSGIDITGSTISNTGIIALTQGNGVTISGTNANKTIALPTVGTATTTAYPSAITTDAYGRITSATAGQSPLTSLSPGSGISVAGNQITNTGIVALTQGNGVTISGTNANKTIALPTVGTAATTAYPSAITTDAYGRITSATAGLSPLTSLSAGSGISVAGNQITNTGIVALTQGNGVTISGTNANKTIALPTVGTANTYAYPQSLTTDAYGRLTSVTAGSAPTGIVAVNGTGNRITASTVSGTTTLDLGSIRTAATLRPASITVDVYGRVSASIAAPYSDNIYTTNQTNLSAPAQARSLQITLVGGGGGGSGASSAWGGSQWFAGHGGGGGSGYRLTKTFAFNSSCVIHSITVGAGGTAGYQPPAIPPTAGDGGPGGDGGETWITLTVDGVKQTYYARGGQGGRDTSATGQDDDGANGGAGYGGGGGGCSNGYGPAGSTYGAGGAGDVSNGGQNGSNGQFQSFGATNLPGGAGGMNYTLWPYNSINWSSASPVVTDSLGNNWSAGCGAGGGPYGGFGTVSLVSGSAVFSTQAPRPGYGGGGHGGFYTLMSQLDNLPPSAGAGGQVQVTWF
jgi:hypothetical protein